MFDRRLRAVRREVAEVVAGQEEAIHRMRVATRRLREALPVLEARADQAGSGSRAVRKIARQARRLTRALGGVRELDVAIALLDEIERSRPSLHPAAGTVRQVVAWERELRRAALIRRLQRTDLENLRQRIADLILDFQATAAGESWKVLLASRIERRAAGVRAAIDRAGHLYAPDRLHGVRIEAKKLRYSLELARELDRVPTLRALRQLKQMQDLLGRMHDLEVLAGYTRLLDLQFSTRGRQHARIAGLLNTIEQQVRQLHATYLQGRPALDEVIARCDVEFCPRLGGHGLLPAGRRAAAR